MSLLHPAVARRKFPFLLEKFRQSQPTYSGTWRLARASFPLIEFEVLNTTGVACVGILVNAQDWPHRSISVTLMDRDFSRYIPDVGIPMHQDAKGQTHVFVRHTQDRLWFCVPGTDEYHSGHNAGIPWEAVRELPEYDPVLTLARCIERLDRAKLTPIERTTPVPKAPFFLDPAVQRWMPHGP